MSTPAVMSGAEPMSRTGTTGTGVLVLHGFTGNPSSMRAIAEAMAAADHDVEMPRLPGHGTTIEDMLDTCWADWTAEVARAHAALAARVDRVVVAGLSMGGALALWAGLHLDHVDALVCVNPATVPQGPDVIEMIQELVDDGIEVAPAVGGDIADPDAVEITYDGAPLRALMSLQMDGLAPMTGRFAELEMPLLLFTSRQDHVVEPADSEHLAATYGGQVEHVWLERSYHVATQDYDAPEIIARTTDFVADIARAGGR